MTSLMDVSQNDPLASRLRLGIKYLVRCERAVSALMLVVILVTMAGQVFARYVLHQPFGWSEELSRLAMIWMSFTAAAFIMAEGNHIAVDVWTQRLTEGSSRNLQQVSYIVVAASCLMLFIGGWNFVHKVHPVGSPTLGIPKSFWYGAVSIGLLLMALHSLANFWLVSRTGRPYISEFIDQGSEESPPNASCNTNAINESGAST